MITDSSTVQKVLCEIDRNEATKLAMDLVDIPSPPGHERRVGEYIIDFFDSLGLRTVKHMIDEDRCTAVGILGGTGDGYSLSFNGHLDVSVLGFPGDIVWMRKEIAKLPQLQPKAYLKDGMIFGAGIANMKAGLAAIMTAAKALKKSGAQLKGDVIFAGVPGEIARAPVDEYWGHEYEGGGFGSRYLVARGVISDYAVCCDGSNMKLSRVQAGVVYIKITTYGMPVYVPFVQRDWNGRQSVSALAKIVHIINAIEDWAVDYEKKYVREYDGEVVAPKVCVGCVKAGAPYRPSITPGIASIYVDVRTPPGVTPLDIKRQFEEVVKKTKIEADIHVFRSQLGHFAKGAEELTKTMEETYKHLFGKPLEKALAEDNSMWTDMNVYNEIGVPSIKIGPSPEWARDKPDYEYGVAIEEIVKAAELYAIIALETCNRERK